MKNRRTATVQRILGFLIAGASLMMLPPAAVSLWYMDGTATLFLVSAVVLFLIGMVIFLPVRHVHEELRLRDGFLVVVVVVDFHWSWSEHCPFCCWLNRISLMWMPCSNPCPL